MNDLIASSIKNNISDVLLTKIADNIGATNHHTQNSPVTIAYINNQILEI